MVEPKVVLLIFVSGKIVLTGAKVSIRLSISLPNTPDRVKIHDRPENRCTKHLKTYILFFWNFGNTGPVVCWERKMLKREAAEQRKCN